MIYLSYFGENPEKHLIFYADNWDTAISICDELFGEEATLDEFETIEQALLGIEFFDEQTKIDCSIECSKCKFYEICGMPKRQKEYLK